MLISIKILLLTTLVFITYQDIKDREVYWFLFPLVTLFCGVLHYLSVLSILFWMSVLLNLIIISTSLLVVTLYVIIKNYFLKQNLKAKDVIGLGDVLLFVSLAFSFSSISFAVIFTASLCFSLLLHLLFKHKSKHKTVPLAGHMSIFFALTYLGFWFGPTNILYSI